MHCQQKKILKLMHSKGKTQWRGSMWNGGTSPDPTKEFDSSPKGDGYMLAGT